MFVIKWFAIDYVNQQVLNGSAYLLDSHFGEWWDISYRCYRHYCKWTIQLSEPPLLIYYKYAIS
ncbi:hypothetical protein HGH93_08645 [Chitinophaga polysaccharea]|uniref:hypothetical protein n=1 Tax=Chitinophaga polysaccharea TaxID=1293035 RepID=UPI001455BCFE|nr:hypothetical protein [Chitinophaga polysaccharea]NLR58163.1 hypothetical protein [Chitinophaga polysaccharea]